MFFAKYLHDRKKGYGTINMQPYSPVNGFFANTTGREDIIQYIYVSVNNFEKYTLSRDRGAVHSKSILRDNRNQRIKIRKDPQF